MNLVGFAAVLGSILPSSSGAEHGEHSFQLFTYVSTLINFLVMFGFLAFVLRKPINTFLETRRDNMAKELREAKAKQEEAAQRIAEYQHKFEHLEEEVERIVHSFGAQGEADRERLRQDADRAVDRLVREADFTIRQEIRKAEKTIRHAAGLATLEAAERVVRERITDADRRRLTDEYISSLDRTRQSH